MAAAMSAAIRSVDQLRTAIQNGATPKYLFFWGHTPSPDGSITKSCFSQWWESPFIIGDVVYKTAEHFMMASKAALFRDEEIREKILATPHPKQAKDFGRKVRGFEEEPWVKERFQLVVTGNLAKFSQSEPLRNFLLGTGERVLVEASPMDRIWGIGLAKDDINAERPENWKGLNLLGFALMEARNLLRQNRSA